jgi:hypothetical protein
VLTKIFASFFAPLMLVMVMVAASPAVIARADDDDEGRSAINHVLVLNERDGSMRIQTKVQLNFLKGDWWASPENVACASNGGLDACFPGFDPAQEQGSNRTSIAVALQLNLFEGAYRGDAPAQASIAKNEKCGDNDGVEDDCFAYANATQSTFAADFDQIAKGPLRNQMDDLERQLEQIGADLRQGRIGESQVAGRVDNVVNQFCSIAAQLGGGCALGAAQVSAAGVAKY